MPQPIRFGIPSVDELLGTRNQEAKDNAVKPRDDFGFWCPANASGSFCLIGPHGTGKSVLALHLASRYFADFKLHEKNCPARVFYVSTDLSFPMADDIWQNFALNKPAQRVIPFGEKYVSTVPTVPIMLEQRIPHAGEQRSDGKENSLAEFLARCRPPSGSSNEVTFVDLAEESAGDDWGFIHRLIAVLNEPDPNGPLHLVIIDAVEGLETLVGALNAFGEASSRRSRIAQMLRTAFRKCHLLFVVEEPAEGTRVPEEFVSDVVIRLRSVRKQEFDRRTIEVQKVRGQSHIRGQHPYVIRSGAGSSTGAQYNLDDPPVPMNNTLSSVPPVDGSKNREFQAYVHAMHSIHHLSRNIMIQRETARSAHNPGFAEFGIPHLDSMLGRDQGSKRGPMGLPLSTVTALIGDAGTHKSALAKAFLYRGLCSQSPLTSSREKLAVLLTTSDIDADGLAENFLTWDWIGKHRRPPDDTDRKDFRDYTAGETKQSLAQRIICRRLEIHNQTAEIVMHVVRSAIIEAQGSIGLTRSSPSTERYRKSWGIRVVIDDFSILRSMYPAIREDPLFLPFLVFYLRREGVTSLIIDTHPGRPDREGPALFDDELRAIVDNHLYTWRVPFHGESRIAISAIPPISPKERSRIREVRWDPHQDVPALPTVDRNLELYTGLEQGIPHQIPVEVRLYAETDLFQTYIAEMNKLLADLFVQVEKGGKRADLVTGVPPQEYGYLHDLCNLQGERSLDHTLILQVDEFWALGTVDKPDSPSRKAYPIPPLRSEKEYLEADLDVFENEPRRLFQGRPKPGTKPDVCRRRVSYFELPDCPLEDADNAVIEGIDRIPFMWEFGFLLCRKKVWEEAAGDEFNVGREKYSVEAIRRKLPWTQGYLENDNDPVPSEVGNRATWRQFLGACQTISKRLVYRNEHCVPFEISTVSGESFSCLVLEMWASEILLSLRVRAKAAKENDKDTLESKASSFVANVSKKQWANGYQDEGLHAWFKDEQRVIDFYMAWLLLIDVLPLEGLVDTEGPLSFAERLAPPTAVSSRQWYKTACQSLSQNTTPEPMMVMGLPGHFSMRGDWFLGVVRGSRSDLRADRALDIFSSRRNNFTRLFQGLGLPARSLGEADERKVFRTALRWNDEDGNPRSVRYEELLSLGGGGLNEKPDRFCWLWRSSLKDYHRQARLLHRWNQRTILMWRAFKADKGPNWKSGFEIYDALTIDKPKDIEHMNAKMREITQEDEVTSWDLFRNRCALFTKLLEDL